MQLEIPPFGTQLPLDRVVLPTHVQFYATLEIKQIHAFILTARTKLPLHTEQLLADEQV